MGKIDWKARIQNKTWWVSLITAILLLGSNFGFDLTKYIGANWQSTLNVIFTIITLLGITVDNSTTGISDSTNNTTVTIK